MKRATTHLAFCAFFLAAVPVVCASQEVTGVIASSDHWADSRNSRRGQAAEWLAEVSKLDKQIPTLSPSEEAWLKTEYDDEIAREGHGTARAIRARNGKEGSARFAKPIAKNMVSILEQLASGSTLSQRTEVALWSRLAYFALDANFWGDIDRLGELGVLARDPKVKLGTAGWPSYQEALLGIWAGRAQMILDAIVLPFLESRQQ